MELFERLLSSGDFLGALLGVLLGQFLSQKHTRKTEKLKAQQEIFTEYGERYAKIMGEIVKHYTKIEDESFDFENQEQRKNTTEYFLLIADQYMLYKKDLVAPEVWKVWNSNIEKQMKCRFFKEAYVYVESQIDLPIEFNEYLELLNMPYEQKLLYDLLISKRD